MASSSLASPKQAPLPLIGALASLPLVSGRAMASRSAPKSDRVGCGSTLQSSASASTWSSRRAMKSVARACNSAASSSRANRRRDGALETSKASLASTLSAASSSSAGWRSRKWHSRTTPTILCGLSRCEATARFSAPAEACSQRTTPRTTSGGCSMSETMPVRRSVQSQSTSLSLRLNSRARNVEQASACASTSTLVPSARARETCWCANKPGAAAT
mmetsp:Transcript_28806/g.93023  ORF Transcript_28806/g.93023 Transcript_28806/m.93023 type:complete len:218 (+) Transcript_28806:1464-2117(+)|eukprot:scaffold20869_cov120-Isochrysis_galbana.AAC.1